MSRSESATIMKTFSSQTRWAWRWEESEKKCILPLIPFFTCLFFLFLRKRGKEISFLVQSFCCWLCVSFSAFCSLLLLLLCKTLQYQVTRLRRETERCMGEDRNTMHPLYYTEGSTVELEQHRLHILSLFSEGVGSVKRTADGSSLHLPLHSSEGRERFIHETEGDTEVETEVKTEAEEYCSRLVLKAWSVLLILYC